MLELGLGDFFLQVVNGLEKCAHLLRMHLVQSFDLLLASGIALLKLFVLLLQHCVLAFQLIVLLLEQVDQLILRLVFAELHFLRRADSSLNLNKTLF